jgi:hypothetical protein
MFIKLKFVSHYYGFKNNFVCKHFLASVAFTCIQFAFFLLVLLRLFSIVLVSGVLLSTAISDI